MVIISNNYASYTATAALLLLLSDQRFFFTNFGFALGVLDSLPDLGGACTCTGGSTISFGCGRLASSKSVGRAVAVEVSRLFSSLPFAASVGEGVLGSIVTITSDLIVSSSVNLVILETLRGFFGRDSATAIGAIGATVGASSGVTGETSSSLEGCIVTASTSSFSTVLGVTVCIAFAARDALDATGTMVTELAADEDTVEVVRAVPNWMGGSAGTGGIPEARELVRVAYEFREGATVWFGSETLREWPGCSR